MHVTLSVVIMNLNTLKECFLIVHSRFKCVIIIDFEMPHLLAFKGGSASIRFHFKLSDC